MSSVYRIAVCVFVCVLYFFSFLCIFCLSAIQNFLLAFSLTLLSTIPRSLSKQTRKKTFRLWSAMQSSSLFHYLPQKKMNTLNDLNLNYLSLNVRGLNKTFKRRLIFRWLHKQKQHSHGTNHSKGVMILINPSVDCKIEKNYL